MEDAQIPFEDFKKKLIASDASFKSFTSKEIKKMYGDQHPLSLYPKKQSGRFFVAFGEEAKGPYTFRQLQGMWGAGALNLSSLYRSEDSEEWKTLEDKSDLLEAQDGPDMGIAAVEMKMAAMQSVLSRIAGILAFFLIVWIIGTIIGLISPAVR